MQLRHIIVLVTRLGCGFGCVDGLVGCADESAWDVDGVAAATSVGQAVAPISGANANAGANPNASANQLCSGVLVYSTIEPTKERSLVLTSRSCGQGTPAAMRFGPTADGQTYQVTNSYPHPNAAVSLALLEITGPVSVTAVPFADQPEAIALPLATQTVHLGYAVNPQTVGPPTRFGGTATVVAQNTPDALALAYPGDTRTFSLRYFINQTILPGVPVVYLTDPVGVANLSANTRCNSVGGQFFALTGGDAHLRQTADGWRVVGVNLAVMGECATPATYLSLVAPVGDQVEWIRSVISGTPTQ
jgi:hypothetical protein